MLTAARRAIVFELDPDKGCLSARAVRGLAVEPGFTLRLGEGVVGHAALNREPVWSDDVLARPFAGHGAPSLSSGVSPSAPAPEYGGRAILAAPVISRDTVLGAVCVCWDEVHAPDEREIRMLSALARQAAIAMENARLVGDLRHTLDELRAAQETLIRGATLRAVGEVAAGAAHHLNNLLAVILGRTQLLLMKRPEPSIADNLRSVERAAVDAADTVRRIQGFSGTTKAGKAARFDLNVVVREVMEFTRPRWQNDAKVRGATIEMLTQPDHVPAVFGQHLEISEALTNLVLNAADALAEGGRITIATRAEGERVFVSVRDTGTGMSAEVKRRAFEPFFTTKGVKRTGLGLAVAYGTVQRHGGQISIESVPGAGTTVTLWLPAATRAEEPIPVSDNNHAGRVGSVLVIDDETDVRDLVVDVLRSRGHHITAAAGGREGLERFEAGRYDVVLTDLGMPEVNGWEVARAVKASRTATSVLLLTGWADAMDVDSASLVDGVLRKPFGVDQLAAAVAAALAAR